MTTSSGNFKLGLVFLLVVVIIFTGSCSYADNSKLYDVQFNDSLILDENSHVASNVIRIRNVHNEEITIGVSVRIPRYWKMISELDDSELQSFVLKPDEVRVIPVNLIQTAKVRANWDSVQIKVWAQRVSDTTVYYSRLKVKEQPAFYLQPLNEEQNLPDVNPGAVIFKTTLKNSGNVDDIYAISWTNQLLAINKSFSIRLSPGRDTELTLSAKIKPNSWKQVYTESIYFKAISNITSEAKFITFKISRPLSILNQNESAYKVFPITVGGGLMSRGNDISYFGQIRGQLNLGQHYLNFSYRSKDFGPLTENYQPNAFYLSYNYKKWQLEGGQIQGPRNFFTFGQGASIHYTSQRVEISVSGIKHSEATINSPNLINDDLYGNITYKVRKGFVTHRVETNFDSYYGINSYLLNNEIIIIKHKEDNLNVYFGGGFEDKLLNIPGITPRTYGWCGGYELYKRHKRWLINSNVRYQSTDFPGIYKGLGTQIHELKYFIKNNYIGALAISNSVKRNTLKDTLYNSDYLATNSDKFGLEVGRYNTPFTYNLASGIYRQKGDIYTVDGGAFVDANVMWTINKKTDIRFSSYNAVKPQDNGMFLFITNSQININTKYISLLGTYNRLPKGGEKNYVTMYTETFNGGPSINFSLFNHSLTGTVRYTIGKTLDEEEIRQGVGAQINYSNYASGINIGLNGFYPLKDPTGITLPIAETRYGSLYLNKRIKVPVKRLRYYNLKAILYNDDNQNGRLDSNEGLLSKAIINIDNKTLISDTDGAIQYRNLRPGVYNMGFLNSKLGDLVPAEGGVKTIDLQQNAELLIPFRKGRKIYGNLQIRHDSLSSGTLTPGNFKIIVKDSSNKIYYALTDYKGDFYIFIPEGLYSVSLNPAAFTASDFVPQKMSYEVDMYTEKEAFVQFNILQKKRKIRYMHSDKKTGGK